MDNKKYLVDAFVGYEDGTVTRHQFVMQAESEDEVDDKMIRDYCSYRFVNSEYVKIVVGSELTDEEMNDLFEENDEIREHYEEMFC